MEVLAAGQEIRFPNHFKTVFREMYEGTWRE
jgi:hypothetical protein